MAGDSKKDREREYSPELESYLRRETSYGEKKKFPEYLILGVFFSVVSAAIWIYSLCRFFIGPEWAAGEHVILWGGAGLMLLPGIPGFLCSLVGVIRGVRVRRKLLIFSVILGDTCMTWGLIWFLWGCFIFI